MKKKIVKLNKNHLRALLREAIETREPGSPLWSPPAERRVVKEVGGSTGNIDLHVIRDQWADEMKMRFDPSDPSMEAAGQDAWDDQVEAAASELWDEFTRVMDDVEQKLINGEYFSKYRGM